MKYKVYYSDIWEAEECPVVNEWIYLREEDIPDNISDECLIALLTGEDEEEIMNYEIEDSEEITYILKNGIAILKLEPEEN